MIITFFSLRFIYLFPSPVVSFLPHSSFFLLLLGPPLSLSLSLTLMFAFSYIVFFTYMCFYCNSPQAQPKPTQTQPMLSREGSPPCPHTYSLYMCIPVRSSVRLITKTVLYPWHTPGPTRLHTHRIKKTILSCNCMPLSLSLWVWGCICRGRPQQVCVCWGGWGR